MYWLRRHLFKFFLTMAYRISPAKKDFAFIMAEGLRALRSREND